MAGFALSFVLKGRKPMRRSLKKAAKKIDVEGEQRVKMAAEVFIRSIQMQIRGNRTRAKRQGRKAGHYRKVTRGKGGAFAKTGAKLTRGRGGRFEGTKTRFERSSGLPEHVLAIDSGHLRRSIGSPARGGHYRKGKLLRGGHFVEFGTNVVYALVHEEGRTINHRNLFGKGISARIKMPKRPFFEPGILKARGKASKILGKILKIVKL